MTRINVGIETIVNLGNYENVKVSAAVETDLSDELNPIQEISKLSDKVFKIVKIKREVYKNGLQK